MHLDWFTWVRIIGVSAAAGIAATAAASKWLGKYWLESLLAKQKAEYEQELEHYRAQLDRSVFVTHAHFETEYRAMKEVAQSLSEVKVIWLKLHPIQFGRNDVGLDEGIGLLCKATEAFHEKLEEWAVFIEPEIYEEFNRCYIGADEEWRRLKTGNDKDDRAGTVSHFWEAYRNASQKVRDRIKSLAVIPRT